MFQKILKYIRLKFPFLLVFGLAKSLVYIVPLWLADTLTKENYGVLEYALAGLGLLVSAGFSLGIPGAYPYFILRKKNIEIENAFSIHPLWLLFIFTINQLLYYGFLMYSLKIYLALNFAFLIANQQFYSTKLKSKESILKAVLIDSGVYFILLLFSVGAIFNLVSNTLSTINFFILSYSLLYVIYGLITFYKTNKDNLINKYKNILGFSYHLLIASFLLFSITVGGRILIEYFIDDVSVGIYSFYYRLASVVVIIHQVVNILFFKKIYTYNPKILDNYFSLFFIGIFVVSISVYFIVPFILPHFSTYFRDTYQENKIVFFIISVQMLFWIASALNASIVDRENLTKRINPILIVIIALGILSIYLLKESVTILLITYIHYTVFYLATMIQYYILSKKKILFKKSTLVLTSLYLFSSVLIYFSK